ncbi:hypothetical protein RFI_14598 [Reticulomyxa filosa]|uniref:Uncharacterized protein n=1 Tax=Reticulomyxa filosa TaxID=46433 RepID=X6NA12_RETFI|nr:hypothetical protein RFI_14598 [Reticulomyxa filosa]|eukprot:ETO22594.1 hypothetical protein RFI_14598 [Reticulomyxa filosa]
MLASWITCDNKKIGLLGQTRYCYNQHWKRLIKMLPTGEVHQNEVKDLLEKWNKDIQKKRRRNKVVLTVEKLKELTKTITLYLSKIITKPLDQGLRKINCVNKQYTNLKDIPRIDKFLNTIGYQLSSDVFWLLPIVASDEEKNNPPNVTVNLTKIDYAQLFQQAAVSENKSSHQKQYDFLLCFYVILKHLFDDTLPPDLQRVVVGDAPEDKQDNQTTGKKESVFASSTLKNENETPNEREREEKKESKEKEGKLEPKKKNRNNFKK